MTSRSALSNVTNSRSSISGPPVRKILKEAPQAQAKRQSLAPQAPTGRQSMAPQPARTSLAAKPPAGRQSSIGTRTSSIGTGTRASSIGTGTRASSIGTGTRASSIGTAPSRLSEGRRSSTTSRASSTKVDDRPLTDKAYQRAETHALLFYLTSHGFDKAITEKSITSPSIKDYSNILEFLYRQIEPDFAITRTQEDEAVNYIIKSLRYPQVIPKRTVTNAGAPHTWPALLGLLSWIVELLTYEENAKFEVDIDVGELDHDKMLLDFLCESYTIFLGGTDVDILTSNIAMEYEIQEHKVRGEIENLEAIKQEVLKELEGFEGNPDRVGGLTVQRDTFAADVSKFKKFIGQQDEAIAKQKLKVEELKKESEVRSAEAVAAKQEREGYELVVKNQELNPADIQRINKDRIALADGLAHAQDMKTRGEIALWDTELEISKILESTEKRLAAYHESARKLQLLGPNSKQSNNTTWEIPFNIHSTSAEQQVAKALKTSIKPALKDLKSEYARKIVDGNAEHLTVEETKRSLKEQVSDKEQDIFALDSKSKKTEATYVRERDKLTLDLKHAQDGVDRLQSEVEGMIKDARFMLDNSQKSVEASIVEKAEHSQGLAAKMQEQHERLFRLLDVLTKHKVHIQDRLAKVQEDFVKARAAMTA